MWRDDDNEQHGGFEYEYVIIATWVFLRGVFIIPSFLCYKCGQIE